MLGGGGGAWELGGCCCCFCCCYYCCWGSNIKTLAQAVSNGTLAPKFKNTVQMVCSSLKKKIDKFKIKQYYIHIYVSKYGMWKHQTHMETFNPFQVDIHVTYIWIRLAVQCNTCSNNHNLFYTRVPTLTGGFVLRANGLLTEGGTYHPLVSVCWGEVCPLAQHC